MTGNEIGRKLSFYKEQKIKTHITCSSSRFYNGELKEVNLEKDFVIITDDKIGEVPIMFEEIESIEPFKKKEGGE